MGRTGLQQFVYSSHQLCSVDETQVERVKTVKTCKRAQVYPQAGGFNWPQTTLPSVARGKLGTDQLQLPKPRAPAIKYGASTGVYCRGQNGNKPHPPNHPTVPMPISRTSKDEEALRTSYMALSIQSQENRAPKEKKKSIFCASGIIPMVPQVTLTTVTLWSHFGVHLISICTHTCMYFLSISKLHSILSKT